MENIHVRDQQTHEEKRAGYWKNWSEKVSHTDAILKTKVSVGRLRCTQFIHVEGIRGWNQPFRYPVQEAERNASSLCQLGERKNTQEDQVIFDSLFLNTKRVSEKVTTKEIGGLLCTRTRVAEYDYEYECQLRTNHR